MSFKMTTNIVKQTELLKYHILYYIYTFCVHKCKLNSVVILEEKKGSRRRNKIILFDNLIKLNILTLINFLQIMDNF